MTGGEKEGVMPDCCGMHQGVLYAAALCSCTIVRPPLADDEARTLNAVFRSMRGPRRMQSNDIK